MTVSRSGVRQVRRFLLCGSRLIAANIAGTAVALNIAPAAGVRRFVHLSSIGAFGAVDTLEGPIDQARPSEPTYLYGISKWSAERVASGLAELLRVELDIVRLSSVYGPFEYESGDRDVMSPHLQMLRAAIDGVSLRLSGVLRADLDLFPCRRRGHFESKRARTASVVRLSISAVTSSRTCSVGARCSRSGSRAGTLASAHPDRLRKSYTAMSAKRRH